MNGIGRDLMDAVLKESVRLKCKGIQWQVLEWNEPAITFYKKYKPELDPEWVNCRMSLTEILNYLSTS